MILQIPMNNKTFEDFQMDCNNRRCNRKTIYNNKTCIQVGKQKNCFKLYSNALSKIKKPTPKQNNKQLSEIAQELSLQDKVWIRESGSIPITKTFPNNEWQKHCQLLLL